MKIERDNSAKRLITLNRKLDTLYEKLSSLNNKEKLNNVSIELKQKGVVVNQSSQQTNFFVTTILKPRVDTAKMDSLLFDDEVPIEDCFTDERCLKTFAIFIKTKNDSLINSTLSFKFFSKPFAQTKKVILRLTYGYLQNNGNIELRFTDRPWMGRAYPNYRNVIFTGVIKNKNLIGSIAWYEFDDSKNLHYNLNMIRKKEKTKNNNEIL